MLEFPIIVIDSSYIIPPYECPMVENVRQSDVLEDCAILLWNTHPDQNSWQVSYGPQGTLPEEGTIINCPIQVGQICGLDTGVHYTAYVRAVCDHDSICYSQWSEPVDICLKGNTHDIVSAMDALTYIVPNPAKDAVQVLSSFSMNRVEVFDLNGRTVADIAADGISTTFSVKGWPSGMYIIIIHTPAGNISKRLIVNSD